MKKKTIIIFTLLVIIAIIPTISMAGDIGIDPGAFSGASSPDPGALSGKFGGLASTIYTLVMFAGGSIAAIYITILGIKYMLSSTEDRADIKKRLVPFVIGVAIFFGSNLIINILVQIAAVIK